MSLFECTIQLCNCDKKELIIITTDLPKSCYPLQFIQVLSIMLALSYIHHAGSILYAFATLNYGQNYICWHNRLKPNKYTGVTI